MSNPPADSPALPPPAGDGWLAGPKPPREGWTGRKFIFALAFVLAFHVALIFLFGTKKQIVPRAVTNVPHLLLADDADELIALGDPTLFARPNAHDLVTVYWRRLPAVAQPTFDWTEAPRYLPPTSGNFGALFRQYVQQSHAAEFPLNFKPEPKLTIPPVVIGDAMPVATTMQITGELGRRPLLHTVPLPSLPRGDVLEPSTVQVLVETTGNVASPVILNPTTDPDADQLALQLVRKLRFAPAPALMLGEITFTWHTAPTNTVPVNAP